jgi:hypothetical protein
MSLNPLDVERLLIRPDSILIAQKMFEFSQDDPGLLIHNRLPVVGLFLKTDGDDCERF